MGMIFGCGCGVDADGGMGMLVIVIINSFFEMKFVIVHLAFVPIV